MGVKRQQGRGDQKDLFDEALKASLRHGVSGEGGTGTGTREEQQAPTAWSQDRALTRHLMEKVASSANLNRAYKRVKANGGAPGVDGMTVADLRSWIAENRERLIVSLLDGSYRPQPVRGVEIPKPGGGMRQLGIPTVVDRLVQRRLRKPWNRCSTRRSRRRASASARGVGRTTPCDRPGSTWPTGTRSSRTSTWKSSSTG
jgi:RNA-directed DNA polymerase